MISLFVPVEVVLRDDVAYITRWYSGSQVRWEDGVSEPFQKVLDPLTYDVVGKE